MEALKRTRITTVSAAWVFYFLTALLPLAFLLITAFAVFGVNLADKAVGYLPEEFRPAGEAILSAAENASHGITVFFVLTVLFSGSTLLARMSKDGEFLYEKQSEKRNPFLRRLWAVFALCVLFAVFLLAAVLFAFKEVVFPAGAEGKNGIFLTALAFLLVISVCYVIIILLNKFIAPVKLGASALALGSFVSLFVTVAGTIGFTLYLRFFSSYNAFYGSLAAVIVFLLWAYIVMTGLFFGSFVCMRAQNSRQARRKEKTAKAAVNAYKE